MREPVGGGVEFPPADVNLAMRRLPKRDYASIQAMDQCAEGDKIQRAILTNIQTMTHVAFLSILAAHEGAIRIFCACSLSMY